MSDTDTHTKHKANTFVFKWYVPMVSISGSSSFFLIFEAMADAKHTNLPVRRGERERKRRKKPESNGREDGASKRRKCQIHLQTTQWRDNKTHNNRVVLYALNEAHFYDIAVCASVCFFWIRNNNKGPNESHNERSKEITHCFLFIFCIKYRKQQQQQNQTICHKRCFSLSRSPLAKPYTH